MVAENRAVCLSAGKLLEDPFDIFEKTHLQHLVALIQDQAVNGLSLQGAAADMIHNPAGSSDHYLNAAM